MLAATQEAGGSTDATRHPDPPHSAPDHTREKGATVRIDAGGRDHSRLIVGADPLPRAATDRSSPSEVEILVWKRSYNFLRIPYKYVGSSGAPRHFPEP